MLFADDWKVAAGGNRFAHTTLTFFFLLDLMGVPLSWRKCGGGFCFNWCGYEVNLREWSLGISAARAEWVIGWLDRVTADCRVRIRELREALGRMVFVYGAVEWDRPYLAPLFSWVAVSNIESCPRLPVFVMCIMKWLRERLATRRSFPCAVPGPNGGS